MIPVPTAPLVVYRRGEREDHRGIKLAVAQWLFEHRFWQVATEVELRAGIVDVAGATPWMSPSAAKFWVTGDTPRSGIHGVSIVVEVKATRADFLSDRSTVDATKFEFHLKRGLAREMGAGKWQRLDGTCEGHLRYVAALPGVVRRHELPLGWGLLEWDGRLRRVVKATMFRDVRPWTDVSSAIATTWTKNAMYAQVREAQREFQAKERERKRLREVCVKCKHFDGPRRRPKGSYAHQGRCSILDRAVSAQGHPVCSWAKGVPGGSFEPLPRAQDGVMTAST